VAPGDGSEAAFDDELKISEHFPHPTIGAWEGLARNSSQGRSLSSLDVETHEGLVIRPLYTAEDIPPDLQTPVPTRPGRVEVACPIDVREPQVTITQIAEARDSGADSLWLFVDRRSSSWGRLTAGSFALFQEAAGGSPIYIDGRGAALALSALFIASMRRLGNGLAHFSGALDIDPVGVLANDGTVPKSLDGCFDLTAECIRWCEDNTPQLRAVAVSTLPHVKAGATAVQELAIMFSTVAAYLRELDHRGLPPDLVCRRLRFVTAIGRDLFMEVAKLRALRIGWARIAEACGVSGDAATVPVHAVTSPRCLTARDPWVNILRGTASAFSAITGGVDVISVLPFDSVTGKPDQFAFRLAVNTGTILSQESSVDRVSDPAAGSYFVERLTSDLAQAAWKEFQRIESMGGIISHLRSGALARELADSLTSKRHHVETRQDRITGVSSYPDLEEGSLDRRHVRTDSRGSQDDLETDVHRAVGADTSSFGTAIEAAHGGITAAELAEILCGNEQPERLTAATAEREAVPFEALRFASDEHLRSTGARPQVFVAVLGSSAENRAAVNAVKNLLASGGLIAVLGMSLDDPEILGTAFRASGSGAAIICSDAERAAEMVPILARDLKALRAHRVLVAGDPGRLEGVWREAGVDGFIEKNGNAVALLRELLRAEGVDCG
jgi:methylmalonyl-CoA mutase